MLWSPALALFCLFSGTEVRVLASVLHKKMSPRKIILSGVTWFIKISYQKGAFFFFFSKSQCLGTLLKRYLHKFVSCPVQFNRKKKVLWEFEAENITREIVANVMSIEIPFVSLFSHENTASCQNPIYSTDWSSFQFYLFIDSRKSSRVLDVAYNTNMLDVFFKGF